MIKLTVVLGVINLVAALALGFVYESTSPKIEAQKQIADDAARRAVLPQAMCGVFVPADSAGFTYYKAYADPDTAGLVGYAITASGRGYSSRIEAIVGVDLAGKITGLKITAQQETPGLGTKIQEVKSTRTVLDAVKEIAGGPALRSIPVEISGAGNTRCIVVEIRDPSLCVEVEKMVAARDTAGIVGLLPRAFRLAGPDSSVVSSDPALACAVSEKVLERLRSEAMPWFLQQFVGKGGADIALTKEKTDKSIQAITGATISSRAVVESVRDAMAALEKAVGGFGGGVR